MRVEVAEFGTTIFSERFEDNARKPRLRDTWGKTMGDGVNSGQQGVVRVNLRLAKRQLRTNVPSSMVR